MQKYWFIIFLLNVVIGSQALIGQNENKWEFKNKKDGVETYFRKNAEVYELKLVASIKTSLSGINLLFSEPEHYAQWGYKVSYAKLLKKVSETEIYYYTRLDFPWPMDDRDVIMHSVMEQDPVTKKTIAKSVSVPDYLPEVKGCVRMRQSTTQWTMIPGEGGWLYVEYYVNSSPGGTIPDWMVNMAIDVGPRETVKAIRKFVQQGKYQNAKLAHLID